MNWIASRFDALCAKVDKLAHLEGRVEALEALLAEPAPVKAPAESTPAAGG